MQNLEEETWVPVKGYERYHVSSFGLVKNTESGRIMKLYMKFDGYMACSILSPSKKRKTFLVHRLVGNAFVENNETGKTIDHIDRDRGNNHVSNLRWSTLSEQGQNRKKRVCLGVDGGRAVWKCDKDTGERLELFQTLELASRSMPSKSVNPKSGICAAAKGRVPTAFGFRWRYQAPEIIEGEVWKPLDPEHVRGQEGYHISSEGRIKNRQGRVGNPHHIGNGYMNHSVRPHTFLAHRLVAFTFLEEVPGKNIVNHIDGDKTNCRVSNLEYVTQKENIQHAVDTGLKNSGMEVVQYTLNGEFVKEHTSAASASRELGINRNSIRGSIKRGKSCAGFQWRLKAENDTPVVPIVDSRYVNCVKQYSLDGVFIQEFKNAQEASDHTGESYNKILFSMKSSGETCGGFQWRKSSGNTIPIVQVSKKRVRED